MSKIRLEIRPRFLRLPLLPVLFGFVWAMLVIGAATASVMTGADLPTCHFLAATDIPCAACGGTRAGVTLLSGDIAGAFRYNPLITLTLLCGSAVVTLRVLGGRQIVCNFSRSAWIQIALLLVTAVALNWYYVLSAQSAY